ncbi:dapdiamide synthesis protein DdaC-like [Ptychodera flava]|uniref:dapdiamide synthesis protein DdaC-like n=1 Tax=Ptychodera flava TaxID=63121 RepID=UPI00396A6FD3
MVLLLTMFYRSTLLTGVRLLHFPTLTIHKRLCSSEVTQSTFIYTSKVEVPGEPTARIAWRKWLPGALSPGNKFPEFVARPRHNFPALYSFNPAVADSTYMGDLAKDTRRIMESQLHFYGALLFRGLPLESGDDFSRFMKRLGYTLMDYEEGNYIRDKVAEHVLTASNEPPEYTIDFHSELAFLENLAMKIIFYCNVPPLPGHGGESIIADTRDILKKLHPDFVNKLRKLGVLYMQRLPRVGDGNLVGWEEMFKVKSKADASKYIEEIRSGSMHYFEDDTLVYKYKLPALKTHPKTGEEIWCNQIQNHHADYFKHHPLMAHLDLPDDKYPFHCYYGDGSVFEEEVLQHLRSVAWELGVGFQLQKGDILALDNHYVHHGRLGFSKQRRVFVALTKD